MSIVSQPVRGGTVVRARSVAPTQVTSSAPAVASGDVWQGSSNTAPVAADPRLTAQQQQLVADRLLPANFADLVALQQTRGTDAAKAAFRAGKKGPFSPNYGDPQAMLKKAVSLSQTPELVRMIKDLKKGDVVCIDYNSTTDLIANATKGPFAHVLVCTSDGAPPEFVEAIGMTGSQSDPSNNMVRRSTALDHFSSSQSYRIVRPADALAEPQRGQAIDKAVSYAEAQLGKPYDYTFGESGVGQSFYCSSLGYYAYVKGAGVAVPLQKSSQRDALLLALDSMVDALAPKDRAAVMAQIVEKINVKPAPSADELINFIVQKVLPACSATSRIASTPAERDALATAITRFRTGKGLPRFAAANQLAKKDEAAGKFKTPVIGKLRQLWDRTRSTAAATSDVYHAFDGTGLSKVQAAKATLRLANGFLPFSEAVSAFIFGKADGRTRFFGKVLNTTDWLHQHKPFSWVCGWLPVRGTNAVDGHFISPTDLAWAKVPHADYNVKPGQSLDRS